MDAKKLCGFALAVLLIGCQAYEPKPLDPDRILEETRARRKVEGTVVTLDQAAKLMREHSPRVREARAAYRTALALAKVPTPAANPTIGVTPTLWDAADITGSARYGVEAALGWSVFLGGRRKLTDERNRFVAEAALVGAAATEREEFLGLRRDYVALAVAAQKLAAQEELAAAIEATVATTRRLVEAAQASSLDLREIELEGFRSELAVAAANEELEVARGRLAARAGVESEPFLPGGLPKLPGEVPTMEQLEGVLLRDHPELSRRRAEYEVAEKDLALEVSRQYPALDLGLGYEREPGANVWSLGFGIELPVFDRNQQGIAESAARREQVRVGFEAQATRSLSEIESARARLVARRRRLQVMRERVAPTAEAAIRLARRSLQAGGTDTLRFLTALRVYREIQLERLETQQAVFEAWADLEEACGAPLLLFPKVEDEK